MGSDRTSRYSGGRTAADALLAGLVAATILLTAAFALAQEGAKTNPPPPAEPPGFFGSIMQWFDRQTSGLGSNLQGAGSQVENLGREAGIAAKTTVEGARGVGDAMVKIPAARVITGHEKCALAPNGAPDCLAAANAICKTKGFESGKSVDMTTAEICPAQVYLSGRNSGPGCHTETFVSRALCQ
ncbi:MAG: hypothetical protein ACREB2_14970 [Pseudolabrys sp.]